MSLDNPLNGEKTSISAEDSNLFKGNIDGNTNNGDRYINRTKRRVEGICRSLSTPSEEYKPERTLKSICEYLSDKNKLDRMLYSQFSSYIFSMDTEKRATFSCNIETLLQFVYKEEAKDVSRNIDIRDCAKLVVKLYDHFNLVVIQYENVEKIIALKTTDIVSEIRKENKKMEKEYITILAIFASIVVAFMGGMSFSESILDNFNKSSIYRLLLVMDGMGFVFTNIIYIMIKLIFLINDKDIDFYDIWFINFLYIVAAILIITFKYMS